MLYILSIVVGIALMNLGELLPNETKKVYTDEGYNWNNVLICSNLAAIIGGLLSLLMIWRAELPTDIGQASIPLGSTIISYITMQSFMTDLRTLLINRNILRVAYVFMYILTIYNLIMYDTFKINTYMVIVFTVMLLLIFLFSSIGASDVRAMMVAIPYVSSIGGYISIYMFLASLLVIALYMYIKREKYIRKELRKVIPKSKFTGVKNKLYEMMSMKHIKKDMIKEYNKSGEHGVPVGPFMLAPFMLFLILFPLFI